MAFWHGLSQQAAPGCDRGGWGALRSLRVSLLVLWVISIRSPEAREVLFAVTLRFLNRYSIGCERMVRLVQTSHFWQLIWQT